MLSVAPELSFRNGQYSKGCERRCPDCRLKTYFHIVLVLHILESQLVLLQVNIIAKNSKKISGYAVFQIIMLSWILVSLYL